MRLPRSLWRLGTVLKVAALSGLLWFPLLFGPTDRIFGLSARVLWLPTLALLGIGGLLLQGLAARISSERGEAGALTSWWWHRGDPFF